MLLAAGQGHSAAPRPVYIAHAAPDASRTGFLLARRLRDAGFRAETEQAGRSLKGQLKQADRIGAFATVILGDSIEVKNMETGEQREAAGVDDVMGLVEEARRS
jgi:histidyl-tRNA synthetase